MKIGAFAFAKAPINYFRSHGVNSIRTSTYVMEAKVITPNIAHMTDVLSTPKKTANNKMTINTGLIRGS
ncbi:MAG: hypothetical protein RLZZ480_804 [Candidatus Parcubacteria bacterium]|jgi:hypothetical protein